MDTDDTLEIDQDGSSDYTSLTDSSFEPSQKKRKLSTVFVSLFVLFSLRANEIIVSGRVENITHVVLTTLEKLATHLTS